MNEQKIFVHEYFKIFIHRNQISLINYSEKIFSRKVKLLEASKIENICSKIHLFGLTVVCGRWSAM